MIIHWVCAGSNRESGKSSGVAEHHADAQQMYVCLKAMRQQCCAAADCAACKPHCGTSCSVGFSRPRRDGPQAKIVELAVQSNISKGKHAQNRFGQTVMKGFMQEDAVFAFSTSRPQQMPE